MQTRYFTNGISGNMMVITMQKQSARNYSVTIYNTYNEDDARTYRTRSYKAAKEDFETLSNVTIEHLGYTLHGTLVG